ncbi:MAG: hypothetical protein P3A28_07280 [Gemmatimonadota bacterium]|nr:hypothetical protein [Gemmatimonadota bacterium]
MVGLSGLWLPILLSGVFVFIASSVIHMALGYHAGDFKAPPQQDALADAMRPFNLEPGDYMMPKPSSMKEMGTPEYLEKHRKGPVAIMTVLPSGHMGMGKQLGFWFVFTLVVSAYAAYLTGRTNAIGAGYLTIFRVAGTVSFGAYALGQWPQWIWFGKSTRATLLGTVDALVYSLITAGVFGWLWPR